MPAALGRNRVISSPALQGSDATEPWSGTSRPSTCRAVGTVETVRTVDFVAGGDAVDAVPEVRAVDEAARDDGGPDVSGGVRSTLGSRPGRAAVWLAGSVAVVLVAARVVGVETLVDALAGVDRGVAAAVGALALATLAARGTALWVVLGALDRPVSLPRALTAYAAAAFVNTVAPSGQAGGTPVSGLLVARSADADYEEGVAAVVSLSLLANAMVALFGLVGVGYLLATAVPRAGDVAVLVVSLVAAGLLALAAVHRSRTRLVAVATGLLWWAVATVGRLPRVSVPDRTAVEARVDRFLGSFGRLRAAPRRRLVAVVALMALAHATSLLALWLSFVALGHAAPLGVIVAVVPAAVLAAVVPLPGGVGGVDVALVGLLTAATPVAASVVAGAVVLYRTASYWPRLVLGGGIVLAMLAFGWLSEADDGRLPTADEGSVGR
ncbi:flippase-like domain-containing protein [Halobium salinum]|uniref:Flippase-like domain-containing protein n=1 Tax=Halobium salinum TaxID=1364940 RepID=A0ABD5P987_9EURY|nr:flippase-like domain-containing protein [Halobium salinum]